MKFRKAKNTEKDLKLFIRLKRKHAYGTEHNHEGQKPYPIPKEELSKEFRRIFKSSNAYLFFAEEHKKTIGYLRGTVHEEKSEIEGEIDEFYIIKNYRNKGLGKELIKKWNSYILRNWPNSKKIKQTTEYFPDESKETEKILNDLDFKVEGYVFEKEVR